MRLVMLLLSVCLGMALVALWRDIPDTVAALALPGVIFAICLTIASGALLSVKWRWLALLFAMLAGHCWALDWAAGVLAQRLPDAWVRQDIWVRGQVSSLIEPALRGQRFTLKVDRACLRLLPENCDWQSAQFSGTTIELRDYSMLAILPGERWRLRVRLRPVHGQANPGGFDLEQRRFARGITTQGYVRDTGFNQPVEYASGLLDDSASRLLRWRVGIADRLRQGEKRQHTDILTALIIGSDHGLSDATWDLLAHTGTTHLLVVSGLHIGLIATFSYLLCRLILRFIPYCWPRLLFWQPAQRLAAIGAIFSALFYSMLAGFSLPTQRAVVMILVLLLGRSSRYRLRSSQSLVLAATLVLMLNPLAIWQAGFWMSFVAVAGLLLAMTGYHRRNPRWQGLRIACVQWRCWVSYCSWYLLRPQMVVSIALLVPLLAGPGAFSVISPLSNLVAVPLMGFLIVPMALTGAALGTISSVLGAACWFVADLGIELLLGWLTWMASTASSLGEVGQGGYRASLGVVAWMLAAIGSLALLLPRGMLPRLPATLLFFPLIWPAPPRSGLNAGEVAVTVIDVGQGLSVLLRTAQHQVLFDTGPPRGEGQRAALGILPVLARHGVDRLDAVIVSHWHDDHAGAIPGLLAQLPIDTVHFGGQLPAQYGEPRHWLPCQGGSGWRFDSVTFEFLHPSPSQSGQERISGKVNNTSCVLRVSNGRESLLLTGDIEAAVEHHLLSQSPQRLNATWLVAPHHGSNTSSTGQFLDAVDPQCMLISAGAYNRFNHPHPDVIQRTQGRGICLMNTAESGALQYLMSATGAEGGNKAQKQHLWREYRQQQARFWRAPPLP
ncbi:DNA internalization-related competence protein ComEC/Rec2 [Pseudohongiella nitratireducens]|uniref:DNA internalization-related competence protein ComEC/Rec2 n=1 Tax=Pseudohongiella nitratireducens TaxID=1768907 RepID=A0A917LUL4_9GAMM|nr:DNA internalization-related competence protein ComEC/Rec2 [Pseudohongiella nitratireducens]MDF1622449.1 DNA internalization-related competence protein ComEC/Rec2 [Pseudohongiella nitratireducens]GGG56299.1 DNA internalization-related competence protein ComEC/Rec2 [Pseudohongiella nitratireducens]